MNHRSLVQTVALTFGLVYTAVGILGLLPFLGGSYTQTPDNLLGFVPINLLHNIVHLVIGVAGLAAATSMMRARAYTATFGIVLIAIGLLGIVVTNPFNQLPIGGFDIAIHLVTGAVLAYFGFSATAPALRPAA